jgi:hypothetical protein
MVTVGLVGVEGGAAARRTTPRGDAGESQTIGNLLCE